MGIDPQYWNVRPDGKLTIRPFVKPMGIYVAFDPKTRKFMQHASRDMRGEGFKQLDSRCIDEGAVAEAIAYALVGLIDG